jgi:chromate reductase
MTTVIGIAGSLRRGSYNAALLRAAGELMPAALQFEAGSIRDIPIYDGDVEAEQGIPPAVAQLKNRIAAAQAILLVTPEYNGSIPGPLKNALDWLSRPPADMPAIFTGKPVGVIGATPGALGTALSQAALLPVLRAFKLKPYFGSLLYVSGAAKVFDENGRLVDDAVRQKLKTYLEGFARFVNE